MPVKTKRTSSTMSTYHATAKRLNETVERHAKGAAVLVSELAPVSEKDHLHMYQTVSAREERKGRWRIIVAAVYSVFQEYGTIFMEAQPFFRPGIASARRALRRDLKIVKGPPRIS